MKECGVIKVNLNINCYQNDWLYFFYTSGMFTSLQQHVINHYNRQFPKGLNQ